MFSPFATSALSMFPNPYGFGGFGMSPFGGFGMSPVPPQTGTGFGLMGRAPTMQQPINRFPMVIDTFGGFGQNTPTRPNPVPPPQRFGFQPGGNTTANLLQMLRGRLPGIGSTPSNTTPSPFTYGQRPEVNTSEQAQPPAPPPSTGLRDTYNFLGGSYTPEQLSANANFQRMLQAYQVQGDPYLSRIDPGAAQFIRDLNTIGSQRLGISNPALDGGTGAVGGPGYAGGFTAAQPSVSSMALGFGLSSIPGLFGLANAVADAAGFGAGAGGIGGYGTSGRGASDPGVMGVAGGLAGRGAMGAGSGNTGGHGVGGSRGDAY